MNTREITILLLMCVVWGFHFVVIKTAVMQLPPIFYAAVRMTLVAALMAPFLRWRRGQMARVLGGGICLGVLNYSLMFTGMKFATASTAAIAMELYVPFATILSFLFLGDKFGWQRSLGITLAFAGVAVIALAGSDDGGAETRLSLGIGLVAAGAFLEAVGAVFVKQSTSFKPHELMAWFGVIGAVGLCIMTSIFESGQREAFAASDKTTMIGAILYSALGASIFGHTAYYWLIKRLPVSLVAPSVLLTTVIAVFSGVVLLGDPLGAPMIIGGLMTLAGVGVVLLRTAKKQDIKAPLTESGISP